MLSNVRFNIRRASRNSESGIYIIFLALLLVFALMAVFALVIDVGLGTTASSRLQNIANVTALSALEEFTRQIDPTVTYDAKLQAALTRANEIIVQNRKLPGIRSDLGELMYGNPGEGGELIPGMWYPERPSNVTLDPCGGKYPCFVQNDPAAAPTTANAMRIRMHTQADNPLLVPFAKAAGFRNDFLTVSAQSTATLVQRCTVYLLDISRQSVFETHKAQSESYDSDFADQLGAFAYLWDHAWPDTFDGQRWQDLRVSRAGQTSPPMPAHMHFRSDYGRMLSPNGVFTIVDKYFESYDGYYGPQPLTNYYLAFNAGLRKVDSVKSPGNKALLYPFTGWDYPTEPPVDNGGNFQLTEDLGYLIHLTNFLNRGMEDSFGSPIRSLPQESPNAIERGWFPLVFSGADDPAITGSNQVRALQGAITALSNAGNCPESAVKAIVMATDGIPSCTGITGNPTVDCAPLPGQVEDPISRYNGARAIILSSLRQQLMDSEISLTTIIDAEGVQPNIANVQQNGDYLNPDQARALGYCGADVVNPDGSVTRCDPTKRFFNTDPDVQEPDKKPDGTYVGDIPPFDVWQQSCQLFPQFATGAFLCDYNQYARRYYNYLGANVKFRDPNGLWGQLAFDTGGVVCPIMPLCDPSEYDANGNLTDAARATKGPWLTCSPTKKTKMEQAVDCVIKAVASNPFQNVEDDPTTQ